ncbi:MAG: sodium:calcium antiporter [Myxococcota bacterium]
MTDKLSPHKSRKRNVIMFLVAGSLPLPWMISAQFDGLEYPPELTATLAGVAILGAAMLLSWATELAERDIPQAVAILVLALVSVLPEYAIDLHFAWAAGKDISMAPYAVANMTGANRLLIGIGWASVVLISCFRSGSRELVIHPRRFLEIRFLLCATLYSFFVPLSGTINLMDAAVLFAIFIAYALAAMRGDSEEIELMGPPGMLDREFGDTGRRIVIVVLFVFSAYGIFISAEPFADSLVEIGRVGNIDEFLLVQWLAPLASESPEFLIAILFAWRLRGSVGIGTLISSKVNQWTLLVGAIPIAFALSSGGVAGLPLDARQTEELILTSAQSLLAVVLIVDLRFSRLEAISLAALFLGQFLFTSTEVRYLFIGFYLALAIALLIQGGGKRRRDLLAILAGKPGAQ